MKLAVIPLTVTCAILCGVIVLLCGLFNMWFPPYAEGLLQLLGSIYPGYTPDGTFGSVVNGAILATVDGAINVAHASGTDCLDDLVALGEDRSDRYSWEFCWYCRGA